MQRRDGAPLIAVDLGGTRIRAARLLVRRESDAASTGAVDLVDRREVATPVDRGPDTVIEVIAGLVDSLVERMPVADHPAARVVLGATGPIDAAGGWVDPSNLGLAFHGYRLGTQLAAAIGRPVRVGLDTHLALLGEYRAGALSGCRDGLYITVSTGVGGAVLVGGELARGGHGLAGEVGHLPVLAGGPRCGCGARGHLEAVASGPALARAGLEAARRGRAPALARRLAATGGGLDGADVAAAAAAGDPGAAAVMTRARRALGRAVAGLVNLLDPERVVLGGGVIAPDPGPWLAACSSELARGGLLRRSQPVVVVPAVLGDDAGLVGCLDHERLGVDWVLPTDPRVGSDPRR